MGVFRLKQNVLQRIVRRRDCDGGRPAGPRRQLDRRHRPDLPDVALPRRQELPRRRLGTGHWTATDLAGTQHAFGAKIDYPNDLWDVAFTYKWVGEPLRPVARLRAATRRATAHAQHHQHAAPEAAHPRPPRPADDQRVVQHAGDGPQREWESYRIFLAPINWRLESGDRYEVNVVPTGERLVAPFEIADGVMIPPGSYHWNRYRLEAQLAAKRKFSGQFTWWFGEFYSGTLDEFIATAAWKPSALFIMEFNATRNVGRLAEGDFTQQVVGTRVRLNVSPDLQFNSYLQYDNTTDSFGTNTRVRWTFSPLGELFVVYNHNIRELIPTPGVPARVAVRFEPVAGEAAVRLALLIAARSAPEVVMNGAHDAHQHDPDTVARGEPTRHTGHEPLASPDASVGHGVHAGHGDHARHDSPAGDGHAAHDKHAGHSVAMFRDKFWLSLLAHDSHARLGAHAPARFGYTRAARSRLPLDPRRLRHRRVPLRRVAVSSRAPWRELRARLPGMMTLIALAITVAFVFSAAVDARAIPGCRSGGSWRRWSRSCCSATGSRCAPSPGAGRAEGAGEAAARHRHARVRRRAERRGGPGRRRCAKAIWSSCGPGASVPADGVVAAGDERRRTSR